MAKKILIKRDYNCSDAKMLEFVRVIHAHILERLSDFTAFDASLDAAWAAAYLSAIDQAENFGSDRQMVGSVSQFTKDRNAKMRECCDYFLHMKYFIESAFPNKPGTWAEFGYKNYKNCYNKYAELVQFMKDLYEAANKHAAALAAKNFDAAKIAHIQTLTTELQTIVSIRESESGGRMTLTNERILLLNQVWKLCLKIRKAAKIIYRNNPGAYRLFVLTW